jgi:hypothetical protein
MARRDAQAGDQQCFVLAPGSWVHRAYRICVGDQAENVQVSGCEIVAPW